MKKIDFGVPPPPPPEIPLPPLSEALLYSPTQYSGVQYSPSQATSPCSEDEKPPPPTPASLPPRKVLGSDQAKRRLQAFAKSKVASSLKGGKVSSVFAEEEEEGKDAKNKKRSGVGGGAKDSTPVMASIMKEETHTRDLVKKSMEIIAQKEAESAALEKAKQEFEEKEDLRDVLVKRRKERERDNDGRDNDEEEDLRVVLMRERKEKERKERERRDKERGRDASSKSSGRDKSDRRSRSRDKSRHSGGGVSPRNRSVGSPEKPKKSKDRVGGRSSETRQEDDRRLGSIKKEKERKDSAVEDDYTDKDQDINDKSRERNRKDRKSRFSDDLNSRDKNTEERDERKYSDKKDKHIKVEKDTTPIRRPKSPLTEAKPVIVFNKEVDSSVDEQCPFQNLINDQKETVSVEKARKMARKINESLKPVLDLKPEKSIKEEVCDDTLERPKKSPKEDSLMPSEEKLEIKREVGAFHQKEKSRGRSGERKRKKRSSGLESENRPTSPIKDLTKYVKAASAEDYMLVKQETRDTSSKDFVPLTDGLYLQVPTKYIMLTSNGLEWSYNKATSEQKDVDRKRNAKIRKSVDSAVSELEREMFCKRSRENSINEQDLDSSLKKKKRIKSEESGKKEKKKKKSRKNDEVPTTKKSKKKKKKKDKEMSSGDIDYNPNKSINSANVKIESIRKRFDSGGATSGPPLSAAGISKLFSMAGYDPQKISPSKEKPEKKSQLRSVSPSPMKPKKVGKCERTPEKPAARPTYQDADTRGRAGTPTTGSPGRRSPDRSPSPSLRGDLSRISSGPRTPSPGPRLPKMKDSRSPSKVPIMRDRRSPIRTSSPASSANRSWSAGDSSSSGKKQGVRRVKQEEPDMEFRKVQRRDPWEDKNQGREPGVKTDTTPRDSLRGGRSSSPRFDIIEQKTRDSPGRRLSPVERGNSPNSPSHSFVSSDRRVRRTGSPLKRTGSSLKMTGSPGRRLGSPERDPVSPDRPGKDSSPGKRISSPGHRRRSKSSERFPDRRSSGYERRAVSPGPRTPSPSRRNTGGPPGTRYQSPPTASSRGRMEPPVSPERSNFPADGRSPRGRAPAREQSSHLSPGRGKSSQQRSPLHGRSPPRIGKGRSPDRGRSPANWHPVREHQKSPVVQSPGRGRSPRPQSPGRERSPRYQGYKRKSSLETVCPQPNSLERWRSPPRSPGRERISIKRSPGRGSTPPLKSPVKGSNTPQRSSGRRLSQEKSPGSSRNSLQRSPRRGRSSPHRSPGRGKNLQRSPGRGWTQPQMSPGRGHSPNQRSPGRVRLPPQRSPGRGPNPPPISPGRDRSPTHRSPGRGHFSSQRSPGRGRSLQRSPDRGQIPLQRSPGRGQISIHRSPGRGCSPTQRSPGRGRTPPQISPGRGQNPHQRSPGRGQNSYQRSPGRGQIPHQRSPGRGMVTYQRSPGRGRSPPPRSPGRGHSPPQRSPRRGRSPLQRSPGRGQIPHQRSPGRGQIPLQRSPGRGRSPLQRSPGRGQIQIQRSPRRGRSPLQRSPEREQILHQRSPGRGRTSPQRSPGRGRSPVSRGPPGRGRSQPPYSPGRRRSPHRSPGRRSPFPRSPHSPGRGRSPVAGRGRPFTPDMDRRPRSRERFMDSRFNDFSPRGRSPTYRGDRSPPGRRGPCSPGPRTPSPDRRRPPSPDRRYFSPARRRFSQERDLRPDSTISDADLARQMPPPSLHLKPHLRQFSSPNAPAYSDSPKRLSLDQRLELEHGIKIEHEPAPPVDFTRPPPGFPPVPAVAHFPQPGGPPVVASSPAVVAPLSAGLPAMIPTYDDSSPVIPVKGPPYPGSQEVKLASEKEQAMVAAQAVASKLQEMQEAKEEERKRKKEQKMAERIAQLEAKGDTEKSPAAKPGPVRASTGRILEEVEKQETEMKEKDVQEELKDVEKKKVSDDKKRKRKERGSPLLITLKPFYRPNEKKDKKKKRSEYVPEPEEPEEEFVPRSPVPLPDKSTIKPVLMNPTQRLKIVKEATEVDEKKAVKYADGVLPGQGSPDHDQELSSNGQVPPNTTPTVPASGPTPRKKRYKKVRVTIITTHTGETDSEEDSPPPPPPGSPPRYRLKELLALYGTPVDIKA